MTKQIAFITGGSRGLGRSAAIHLAQKGVDIVFTYNANIAAAAEVENEIASLGGKAKALQLDVRSIATFSTFAETLRSTLQAHWGRTDVDFLVNNAGGGVMKPFAETTEAEFDDMLLQHLKGVYFLTQALLPSIKDGGRIINITTGLTRFTFPGFSAYAIMKGGLETLTHYLAKELGDRRISVNSLAPGAVETDFGGGLTRDDAAFNAQIASMTALGRAGLPADIGAAVADLLTSQSQWINAQRIEASGGALI